MNLYLLAFAAISSFISILIATPYARKYLLSSGIYGIDQQKAEKPKLPTSGGLVVLFGFLFSVSAVLGISKITATAINAELILAALSSVNIIALIGLVDDIHVGGEEFDIKSPTDQILEKLDLKSSSSQKNGEALDRVGLSQLNKMLFVLPAVFPLMVVGAGSWIMHFPIIGSINWGLIYPLVLLPLGLLFVANVVNMLAGTNGLSTGMSAVAGAGLGIFALLNSEYEAAIIAFSLVGGLAAFYIYNSYPASILPGDSLTYLCGAGLFSVLVIGNMEKFGVFIFIPWIVEFFLKAGSKFKAHSWGTLENGKLVSQHESIYSLTHVFMRKGFNEEEITISLILLEVFVVSLGLFLFQLGLL